MATGHGSILYERPPGVADEEGSWLRKSRYSKRRKTSVIRLASVVPVSGAPPKDLKQAEAFAAAVAQRQGLQCP